MWAQLYPDFKVPINIAKTISEPRVSRAVKTTRQRKTWSKEDEAFLIENYTKLGFSEVAKILNRSVRTVQVKAHRMGVTNKNYYSQEEINFLKQSNGRLTVVEQARLLNRTPPAISLKRQRLGLTASNDDPIYRHADKVLKMKGIGLTHKQIAKAFDSKPRVVKYILEKERL